MCTRWPGSSEPRVPPQSPSRWHFILHQNGKPPPPSPTRSLDALETSFLQEAYLGDVSNRWALHSIPCCTLPFKMYTKSHLPTKV